MMGSKSLKVSFNCFITLVLSIIASCAFSQGTQNSHTYFLGNYSIQPVITFKEGFLNKTTYYLDGEESSPKEVAALLNSVQTEDFKFHHFHKKKVFGTGLMFTGLAVNLGSIGYLFTNEITATNFWPWYSVTLGGYVLQATGNILIQNSDRRIQRTLTDFNAYHYSKGSGAFLSMDVSDNFLGPKIDIYEGPMLLKKDQVLSRLKSNEEAYRMYQQVIKRQNVSTVTNVMNFALGIGVVFVAIGFESQSSSQNQILIPMTLTGIGLNLFSGFFERRTRNLTREALYRYNYQ
jgi:hypothetical protein